uniref:trypsin n=1 Tax=Paramormyrops kingsleyae TaxID=1676925 RepID=A0A3B3QU38_9TELE
MRLLVLFVCVGAAGAVPREDGRIIGGYECIPNSRPWMASLNYGYHFCGAVLINDQWLLSVAHCWYNPYAMQIMLGEHDLRVFEGTEQLMKTDTIIWHPSYDYQTLDYDIMMIKLFHPVTITDSVMPISLPVGCLYAGAMCSVSGWGDNNSEAATSLQCLDLPIVDNKDCQNSYPGMITRNMLCAGFMDGGRDACSVRREPTNPMPVSSAEHYFRTPSNPMPVNSAEAYLRTPSNPIPVTSAEQTPSSTGGGLHGKCSHSFNEHTHKGRTQTHNALVTQAEAVIVLLCSLQVQLDSPALIRASVHPCLLSCKLT